MEHSLCPASRQETHLRKPWVLSKRAELPGLYLQNSIRLKVENDVVAARLCAMNLFSHLTLVSCTLLSDTSFYHNGEGTKETHTGLTAEF